MIVVRPVRPAVLGDFCGSGDSPRLVVLRHDSDAQPVLHTVYLRASRRVREPVTEAWVCNFGYDSDPGATVTP